jgi:hypothetical protein
MSSNSEHAIVAVHEDGLHLLLDDGSSWDISPGPSTKVVLWYETQHIRVEAGEESGDYWLTNLSTSELDRVKATPGGWDPDEGEDDS